MSICHPSRQETTQLEKRLTFRQLGTVGGIIHYITAGFTKFAIIFFNVRLTGSTSRIWIWVHSTCFVVVLAWLLTALFGIAMSCKPYAAVANYIAAGKAGPHLKCNSNNPGIGLALQIMHALLDWILLAVPIIILVRLKMAWQRKVQCIFPLAIGTLSAVGASKRIYDQYHPHPDISCKTILHSFYVPRGKRDSKR